CDNDADRHQHRRLLYCRRKLRSDRRNRHRVRGRRCGGGGGGEAGRASAASGERSLCRSIVLPSAKAKKGIINTPPGAKNSLSLGSRLPSAKPTRNGSTAPTKTCGSKCGAPDAP